LTARQLDRLNDDRLARSLDALASPSARTVFFRLALAVIRDFELAVPRVHFDTTTVTLSGQYAGSRAEPRITQGVNKDHRPDLKQLLFGLNVTSDGAVPLLHHVYSGNRTDDSVHVQNVDLLREILGRGDFVYVADSKLCTKANLEHVSSYGGLFVTVMPRTRKEDQSFRADLRSGAVVARWRKVLERDGARREEDRPDVYACTAQGPQQSAEGYRIVWVRSSLKARQDAKGRLGRLRRAENELHVLADRVERSRRLGAKAVEEKARKILEHYKVETFLAVEAVPYTETERRYLRRGRPRPGDPMRTIRHRRLRLQVSRDETALKAEGRVDGVFPLLTNHPKASKREVIEIYKYQPYIEKRFALSKSEYAIAPIFLKKPGRVAGLIHLYFLAIMCSALIERQVRRAMQALDIPRIHILPEGRPTATPTTPRIFEMFEHVAWHEFEEGRRTVTFPVELNPTQELLLQLLDVPKEAYV